MQGQAGRKNEKIWLEMSGKGGRILLLTCSGDIWI
jgi:hypothetical protein